MESNFWKKYFKVYDVLIELISYQELMEDLITSLKINNEDIILDAGSGTGNFSIKIKERGAKRILSLDFEKVALDFHLNKDKKAEVILHDLNNRLPFSDNFFTKIICNNTLYAIHPKNRMNLLSEFYRVLNKGGKLVMSNVVKEFNPFKIYYDSIKKELKRNGILSTFIKILKLIPSTIKMFYYNKKITKEHKSGNYQFLDGMEQDLLLKNANFKVVQSAKKTYSDQGVFSVGIK